MTITLDTITMDTKTEYVRVNFPKLISLIKQQRIYQYAIQYQPDWFDNSFFDKLVETQFQINTIIENNSELPWLFKYAEYNNRNDYNRYRRFYTRINDIITKTDKTPYFLTLTFNDEALSNSNELTRRKYVLRFGNNMNSPYVANIDYGGENGREHYHMISTSEYIDNTENKLWQYGNLDFEVIKEGSDCKQFAEYMRKLTCHGLKETAGKVIYSRQKQF